MKISSLLRLVRRLDAVEKSVGTLKSRVDIHVFGDDPSTRSPYDLNRRRRNKNHK